MVNTDHPLEGSTLSNFPLKKIPKFRKINYFCLLIYLSTFYNNLSSLFFIRLKHYFFIKLTTKWVIALTTSRVLIGCIYICISMYSV